MRKTAYIEFMEDKGIFDEALIYEGERLSYNEGYALASSLLASDPRPTALFCANDTTATGALTRLHHKKIRVPQDISVVGFNDQSSVRFLDPPLTTVHVPMQFIAQNAVDILKNRVSGLYSLPRKLYIPTSLTLRESTREL
jgi:LacI family transcriptional regulator